MVSIHVPSENCNNFKRVVYLYRRNSIWLLYFIITKFYLVAAFCLYRVLYYICLGLIKFMLQNYLFSRYLLFLEYLLKVPMLLEEEVII